MNSGGHFSLHVVSPLTGCNIETFLPCKLNYLEWWQTQVSSFDSCLPFPVEIRVLENQRCCSTPLPLRFPFQLMFLEPQSTLRVQTLVT